MASSSNVLDMYQFNIILNNWSWQKDILMLVMLSSFMKAQMYDVPNSVL